MPKTCQDKKPTKTPFSLLNALMRSSTQMIDFFHAKQVPTVLIHGVTSTVDAVEDQKSPKEICPRWIQKPKLPLNFKKMEVYVSQRKR